MPSLILPPAFSSDVFDVFFEADERAIAQMQQRNDPARSRIFPYCLSDREGPATFYVNYDPFTSSLLKPNLEFGWTNWYGSTDYLHAEATVCAEEVPVVLRTLDSAGVLDDPGVAPPTTIFLDTQGSELEILLGGRKLVLEHTVAIVTEAEFVPFYADQPLFGDVSRALGELGFMFADFVDGPFGIEPFCTPLGQRGRSMIGFCDALFLRKPETLSSRPVQLAQLAFLALYWEQLAFGFHCLDRLRPSSGQLEPAVLDRTYGAFLADVDYARAHMPILYPPTFVDFFPTYESSIERFDARTTHAELDAHRFERNMAVRQRLLDQAEIVNQLISKADLPIEGVFRNFGLTKQADAIKARRLNDMAKLLTTFAISVAPVEPPGA